MIDSHAHYTHRRFRDRFRYLDYGEAGFGVIEGTLDDVFARIEAAGITDFIEPAIDLASNEEMLELAGKCHGKMHVAVGLHPTRTFLTKWSDRVQLEELSRRNGVVAIGEAGLDYHYRRSAQHRLCQRRWFRYQIDLACERKLPLVLHIRRADKAALRILKRNRKKIVGGVVHCFNGDSAIAEQYLSLGLYFGIGGALLERSERAKTLREAIRVIPLDRILLETDAPFVLPYCTDASGEQISGKIRNASTVILAVAEEIARIKDVEVETVREITTTNARTLFRI